VKPLAIDLYCGLGGWAEGFLLEGYRVIGFDIERHDYGTGGYPGQLVLQDVTTLHGFAVQRCNGNSGLSALSSLLVSGDAVEAGEGFTAAG
jgi:hypothetical protein